MKTKTLKTDAELYEALGLPQQAVDLPGDRYAELTIRDGTVVGARIGKAHFGLNSYSFAAAVEIEHEEAERYRVRVIHPAFPSLNRYFESEYGLGAAFERQYRDIPDAVIDAKKVKVLLDSSGKVIAELDDDGASIPLAPQDNGGDDLPF